MVTRFLSVVAISTGRKTLAATPGLPVYLWTFSINLPPFYPVSHRGSQTIDNFKIIKVTNFSCSVFFHPQLMFALSFLAYTIAFVNGHPKAFSWTPKDSEDDVGFRSLSYGDVPALDDFEKLDDLNDLDFDDDDSLLEYNFMRSNKRSPSSVSISTIFIFLH